MTEREKIFALAKSCDCGYTADEDDVLGSSLVGIAAITSFYHAAQADAFEQAAAMLDTMESEWYDGDQFRPSLPGDCADAIRQLGKEKK